MDTTQGLIYFTTFLASFLGSVHCTGMCGPILIITAKNGRSLINYHLGRLAGYILISLIAFYLGGELLAGLPQTFLMRLGPIMIGMVLITIGIMLSLRRNFHIYVPSIIQRPFQYFLSRSSLLVGFFSFTLPCGWLYAFVIGAATADSAWKAVGIITSFWAGTLPFLSLAPWMINKFLKPIRQKHPRLLGGIVIFLGSVLIVGQFQKEITQLLRASQDTISISDCSLDKESCTAYSKTYGKLIFSLGPYPIKVNKSLTGYLKFYNKQDEDLTVEVDIAGVEMDMGYNRPRLKKNDAYHFQGPIILPTCTDSVMTWRLTLIFNSSKGRELIPFVFLTKED